MLELRGVISEVCGHGLPIRGLSAHKSRSETSLTPLHTCIHTSQPFRQLKSKPVRPKWESLSQGVHFWRQWGDAEAPSRGGGGLVDTHRVVVIICPYWLVSGADANVMITGIGSITRDQSRRLEALARTTLWGPFVRSEPLLLKLNSRSSGRRWNTTRMKESSSTEWAEIPQLCQKNERPPLQHMRNRERSRHWDKKMGPGVNATESCCFMASVSLPNKNGTLTEICG